MAHATPTDGSLRDVVAARDERLPAGRESAAAPAEPDAGRRGRYVLFSIAATGYAVPEQCVTELDRVPRITPVPRAPAWLRGVTNLRGDILSVIDMRTFMGLDAPPAAGSRLLVVRLPDEEFATALVVDAVDRIVALPPDDIVPPASALEGPLAGYLRGMSVANERLVAVLDLDRLLRSPDIRRFDDVTDI